MINLDEDALVCDLAETYQIYDYKQLPSTTVAVFSCGLRENSRIKLKLSELQAPLETLLLAGINDYLGLLTWSKSKDSEKGINRPASILAMLTDKETQEKNELVFSSGEDFERKRKEILGGDEYGD